MSRPMLTKLRARRFRSLDDVELPLNRFSVLVGPNGSGKTNILNVLRFLASTVRFDLSAAIDEWGGFEFIRRQDGPAKTARVMLGVEGNVTRYASAGAPDEYQLTFGQTPRGVLSRTETFSFKRTRGQGRRITVSGQKVEIVRDDPGDHEPTTRRLADRQTTGLATLPDWSDEEGGEGIRSLARFLTDIRVLEPDMSAARQPFRIIRGTLADDASNLASVLHHLSKEAPDTFSILVDEMRDCLPGLEGIEFEPVGGASRGVAVMLRERGVRAPIDLADASFGTVRLLALLAALHEPDPPPFTAIEEADHGLHPYALDLLVERMRAASHHTQLLVTTHAPTFVNRLQPDELVVCGRDAETGASQIPCVPSIRLRRIASKSDLGLGELWFGGALGGVPD